MERINIYKGYQYFAMISMFFVIFAQAFISYQMAYLYPQATDFECKYFQTNF